MVSPQVVFTLLIFKWPILYITFTTEAGIRLYHIQLLEGGSRHESKVAYLQKDGDNYENFMQIYW